MPSEATTAETLQAPYSARCYCGGTRLLFRAPPTTSSYCHCVDCRRWSGAPLAAFATMQSQRPCPPKRPPVSIPVSGAGTARIAAHHWRHGSITCPARPIFPSVFSIRRRRQNLRRVCTAMQTAPCRGSMWRMTCHGPAALPETG